MDKEQANSLVWEVWGMEGPDKEEKGFMDMDNSVAPVTGGMKWGEVGEGIRGINGNAINTIKN